jgi:hypothetical protein
MISSMTCEDARECFRVLLEGKIRLTELAGVEAHISQCAVCREEFARLQPEKISARAPRDPSADESERAALPQGPGRRWRRLSVGLGLAAVVAIAILVVLGVRDYHHNQERERFLSDAMTAGRDRPDREPRELAPPAPTEAPPSPAPPKAVVPPASPAPPKAAPPASPAPRPGVASRSVERGPLKATPLPLSPQPPRRAAPPTAPSPESRPAPPPPRLDVVVQLSVKDRSAAERDLSSLLARVGASQVRRQAEFTFVAVVPQSSYGEFTRGMAQIGAWQMETDRSTVPDPVHVVIRLVSRRPGPGA